MDSNKSRSSHEVKGEKYMIAGSLHFFSRSAFVFALVLCLLFTGTVFAQSTATIQGTVTDATGALVPNATVSVRNQNTGEERTTQSDSAGAYVVPSLPVGTYRVEVKAPGLQTTVASDLV